MRVRLSVQRLIVVPRNGYINRLQSTASASILADQLGAELSVCWLPQVAAPAARETVLGTDSSLKCVTEPELNEILGFELGSFPHYVNSHSVTGAGRIVTFAGHDQGEQPLMTQLAQELQSSDWEVLVIVAGGRFSLDAGSQSIEWDSEKFRTARHSWYQKLELAPEIENSVNSIKGEPFIGMHLRYSDRSHQAPSRTEIQRAVVNLCGEVGVTRVFLASDSVGQREYWQKLLPTFGLSPWILETNTHCELAGAQLALADWRVLGHAQALVYFAESSFGHEASVAGETFTKSIALEPNKLVSAGVQAKSLLVRVLSAPKRWGWF
jgi:hypothetical protein